MPTYLRNFYFQQLTKVKEEEKKELEKSTKKSSNIHRPGIPQR